MLIAVAPAIYHYEIRTALLARASNNGQLDYAHPRQGKGGNDKTAFLESQKDWGGAKDQWPAIKDDVLNRFERQGYPAPTYDVLCMYHGDKIVLDLDNHPVKDYHDIPLVLSSEMEGWLMEAIWRVDSRIERTDFRARMVSDLIFTHRSEKLTFSQPQSTRRADNTSKPLFGLSAIGNRQMRFRKDAGLISWNARSGSDALRQAVEKKRSDQDRANNSIKDVTKLTKKEISEAAEINKGKFMSRAGNRLLTDEERQAREDKQLSAKKRTYKRSESEAFDDVDVENQQSKRRRVERREEEPDTKTASLSRGRRPLRPLRPKPPVGASQHAQQNLQGPSQQSLQPLTPRRLNQWPVLHPSPGYARPRSHLSSYSEPHARYPLPEAAPLGLGPLSEPVSDPEYRRAVEQVRRAEAQLLAVQRRTVNQASTFSPYTNTTGLSQTRFGEDSFHDPVIYENPQPWQPQRTPLGETRGPFEFENPPGAYPEPNLPQQQRASVLDAERELWADMARQSRLGLNTTPVHGYGSFPQAPSPGYLRPPPQIVDPITPRHVQSKPKKRARSESKEVDLNSQQKRRKQNPTKKPAGRGQPPGTSSQVPAAETTTPRQEDANVNPAPHDSSSSSRVTNLTPGRSIDPDLTHITVPSPSDVVEDSGPSPATGQTEDYRFKTPISAQDTKEVFEALRITREHFLDVPMTDNSLPQTEGWASYAKQYAELQRAAIDRSFTQEAETLKHLSFWTGGFDKWPGVKIIQDEDFARELWENKKDDNQVGGNVGHGQQDPTLNDSGSVQA